MKSDITNFQKQLLEYQVNSEILKPWQEGKDPYKIWLFEIIMQQTRMQQGYPYYQQISTIYPTIQKLANATEDDLFRLWKGLGYYSRARNLHYTAKYIANDLEGVFPNTYMDLLKLKGVGEYTAAAIASFAFDEDVAVLDGNVHRVLSRYFGIAKTIQSSSDKKYFQNLANDLLIKGKSSIFNQAMMDMGSYICKPQNPNCEDCSLQESCNAYQKDKVRDLPPPKIRPELKERYFHCLFIESNNSIYLKKRLGNDIWKGLFEGIMFETRRSNKKFWSEYNIDSSKIKWSEWHKQDLSHRRIFMKIAVLELENFSHKDFKKYSKQGMNEIPFPRIISNWWENYLTSSNSL